MYNYGLRAMFDFMVPEPGAFVIAAMNAAHASSLTLTKPPDFPLLPSQIDESNYGFWAHQYGATDVLPPPDLFKTASFDFRAGGGGESTNYNHSGQITLDEGYRAIWGSVGSVYNNWGGECALDVILGQRALHFNNGDMLASSAMADEQGSIPVALNAWSMAQIAVAIEVKRAHRPRDGQVAPGDPRQAADGLQGAARGIRRDPRAARGARRIVHPGAQPGRQPDHHRG